MYICSNRFREDLPQYFNAATWKFPVATSDTLELTKAALEVLETIYRPGISYKKSGVILGNISSEKCVQQDLFDSIGNRSQRLELSRTMDTINQRYGLKTIGLAVEGERSDTWRVKSEHRSPNYLTELDDILTVHI